MRLKLGRRLFCKQGTRDSARFGVHLRPLVISHVEATDVQVVNAMTLVALPSSPLDPDLVSSSHSRCPFCSGGAASSSSGAVAAPGCATTAGGCASGTDAARSAAGGRSWRFLRARSCCSQPEGSTMLVADPCAAEAVAAERISCCRKVLAGAHANLGCGFMQLRF